MLGRCAHDRLSCCADCVAIGGETRRIKRLPGPIYRDADDLALDVIKALQEAYHFGPVPNEEIYRLHEELCENENIKPLIKRDLFHAIGKRLKSTRLKISDPNDPRKTVKCYVVPRPSCLFKWAEWLVDQYPPEASSSRGAGLLKIIASAW